MDQIAVACYVALFLIAVCCVGMGLVFLNDGIWVVGVLFLSLPGIISLWMSLK